MSGSTPPLRALLPQSSSEASSDPSTGSSSSGMAKKARAVVACQSCRKRRTKCSAERPNCSQCKAWKFECHYDTTTESETRFLAGKRKLGELQTRVDAFEEIFHMLQTRPIQEASDVFRRIRDGIDAEAVLRQIRDGDLLLQLALVPESRMQYDLPYSVDLSPLFGHRGNWYANSQLFRATFGAGSELIMAEATAQKAAGKQPESEEQDSRHESEEMQWRTENPYHIPFHVAELVDPLIDAANVTQWTSVHMDNKFLRKLLALYFQYEYPFFPACHKDIMLADMVTGRHRFCSPLLVNTILANACHALSTISHRSEFWNVENPGYMFLTEARRLWELEYDRASVTTVQAGCVLAVTFSVNGLDKIGTKYLVQAVAMAKDLGLFSRTDQKMSKKRQAVRTITAWAIYTLQGFCQYYFLRRPFLETPPENPLPTRDEAAGYFGECWVKYPCMQNPVPLHSGLTILASMELRTLMIEIASGLFGQENHRTRLTPDKAAGIYTKLRDWYERMPGPLTAENVCLPVHLLIHMQYHNMLITLAEPLVGTAAEEYQGLGIPSPQNIVADSTVNLETLLYLFFRRHGFECYFIFLLNVLSQLGFSALRRISLASLPTEERNLAKAVFVLCAKGLQDQSSNFFLAEAVLRMMRHAVTPEVACLLQENGKIQLEAEDREKMLAVQVRADWPVGNIDITKDPQGQRLDELIKVYAGLDLDGVNQSSSSD